MFGQTPMSRLLGETAHDVSAGQSLARAGEPIVRRRRGRCHVAVAINGTECWCCNGGVFGEKDRSDGTGQAAGLGGLEVARWEAGACG